MKHPRKYLLWLELIQLNLVANYHFYLEFLLSNYHCCLGDKFLLSFHPEKLKRILVGCPKIDNSAVVLMRVPWLLKQQQGRIAFPVYHVVSVESDKTSTIKLGLVLKYFLLSFVSQVTRRSG